MRLDELVTPALLVDADLLEHNLRTMSAALPGPRLRPHVKAHKCTRLAAMQAAAGHHGFTCATVREMVGMAAATAQAIATQIRFRFTLNREPGFLLMISRRCALDVRTSSERRHRTAHRSHTRRGLDCHNVPS